MPSSIPVLTRPSKEEICAAAGRIIPDVIAPELKVLFCGINPGLYSGATGYHFARPGNRFWPTLYRAGFMDRLLSPVEGGAMVQLGYGLTNLVERATARADELSIDELQEGARRLEEKVRRYRPRYVAMVGISAYRVAFTTPKATLGRREETLGPAMLWVLPSPSGLNARYTKIVDEGTKLGSKPGASMARGAAMLLRQGYLATYTSCTTSAMRG